MSKSKGKDNIVTNVIQESEDSIPSIIVFGLAGKGKSTILNILKNGDYLK